MRSIPIEEAAGKLDEFLEQAAASREPISITGNGANAVLVSDDVWRGVQETIHLLSIPRMQKAIRNGMTVPLSETSAKPGW